MFISPEEDAKCLSTMGVGWEHTGWHVQLAEKSRDKEREGQDDQMQCTHLVTGGITRSARKEISRTIYRADSCAL